MKNSTIRKIIRKIILKNSRQNLEKCLDEALVRVTLEDGNVETYHIGDQEIDMLRGFFTDIESGLGRSTFSASTFPSAASHGIAKKRNTLLKKLKKRGFGETGEDGKLTQSALDAQEELDRFEKETISGIIESLKSEDSIPEIKKWLNSSGISEEDERFNMFFERLANVYIEAGGAGYFISAVDKLISPGASSFEEFFSFQPPPLVGSTDITLSDRSLVGVSSLNTMTGGGSKGQEVGKGEIAIPFMFMKSNWASGNAVYDNFIDDTGWHLKELPESDYAGGKSIRLGKQGYAGSGVQVFLTSVAGMDASALGVMPPSGKDAKGSRKSSLLKNMSTIVSAMKQGSGYFSISEDEINVELETPESRGRLDRAEAIAAIRKIQNRLNHEMIERSVNIDGNAGGVCYFTPETSTFHFHGLDSIGCAGATQGSHRVSKKQTPLLDTVLSNIHLADFHEVDDAEESMIMTNLVSSLGTSAEEILSSLTDKFAGIGFKVAKSSKDSAERAAKSYSSDPSQDIRSLPKLQATVSLINDMSEDDIIDFKEDIKDLVSRFRDTKNKVALISNQSRRKLWRRAGRDMTDIADDNRWVADDVQSDAREILGRGFLE